MRQPGEFHILFSSTEIRSLQAQDTRWIIPFAATLQLNFIAAKFATFSPDVVVQKDEFNNALYQDNENTNRKLGRENMNTQAQSQVKKIAGTLLIASGVLTSFTLYVQPAKATQIGGGGTCTPHEVTYQQYIPGHYNRFKHWVLSHYETQLVMSTECNNLNPSILPNRANFRGNWRTNSNNSNALTFIAQKGSASYVLTNEQGSTSNAYVVGNRIVAPQWQVNGHLENNDQVIIWSNGTTWSRSRY